MNASLMAAIRKSGSSTDANRTSKTPPPLQGGDQDKLAAIMARKRQEADSSLEGSSNFNMNSPTKATNEEDGSVEEVLIEEEEGGLDSGGGLLFVHDHFDAHSLTLCFLR